MKCWEWEGKSSRVLSLIPVLVLIGGLAGESSSVMTLDSGLAWCSSVAKELLLMRIILILVRSFIKSLRFFPFGFLLSFRVSLGHCSLEAASAYWFERALELEDLQWNQLTIFIDFSWHAMLPQQRDLKAAKAVLLLFIILTLFVWQACVACHRRLKIHRSNDWQKPPTETDASRCWTSRLGSVWEVAK